MKKTVLIAIMFAATGFSSAADIEAGKAKSMICMACHGSNGIGVAPIYPNLAGQKQQYLAKQIKAFKDGTRKDPSMQPMVAPLTEEDIENLAAYFASLPAGG